MSDSGKAGDTPEEQLQAELRITLLNMQLRPVVLFTGVTGLMSAVWSAPAELTSAFKVGGNNRASVRRSPNDVPRLEQCDGARSIALHPSAQRSGRPL